MKARRWFGYVGLVLAAVVFIGWLYLFIQQQLTLPGAHHFEFWAYDGAELHVHNGTLDFVNPGSHSVAKPAKFALDAAAVIVPSVIAMIACILVIRSTRVRCVNTPPGSHREPDSHVAM